MEYKIHTINYYDLLRDLSSNVDVSGNINIPQLTDGEYPQVMLDINTAVRVGYIIINIYIDPSGNTFAQDSSGNNINNRIVVTSEYVYPYFDINNVLHDGYFTVTFDDGSTFGNEDQNDSAFWYMINGVDNPLIIKQYT